MRKGFVSVREAARIALFAALCAVCAQICVPWVVPFTAQTFAALVAAAVLGRRGGTLAVLVYILLGAAGLPMFSGFRGGLGVLLSSTGGYIIGFLPCAYVCGRLSERFEKGVPLFLSMLAGIFVCYAFGTIYYVAVYMQESGASGVWAAISTCVLPFVIPDAIKAFVACVVATRLKKSFRH